MSNKKYPAVYDQIHQYQTLVAQYNKLPNDYIERATRNLYRHACKLIKDGKYTAEQIIAMYPLD